jgi:hypothetical protein
MRCSFWGPSFWPTDVLQIRFSVQVLDVEWEVHFATERHGGGIKQGNLGVEFQMMGNNGLFVLAICLKGWAPELVLDDTASFLVFDYD